MREKRNLQLLFVIVMICCLTIGLTACGGENTPSTFTVTYEVNGGTNSVLNPLQYVKDNQEITLVEPVKEGYVFVGWHEGSNSGPIITKIDANKNADLVLYAEWKEKAFEIKFDKNDENATGEMTNQAFTYGVSQKLKENAFKKTGYKVVGFNRRVDGSGASYNFTTEYKDLADEGVVTLYAMWEANTYDVVYNKNDKDATGEMANQTLTYDKLSKLSENKFTKAGYSVSSWNTKADGTGVSYSLEGEHKNLVAEGAITLYAIWTANKYKVSFNGNQGNVVVNNEVNNNYKLTVTYNQKYGVLPVATREGYSFNGWYTKAENGTLITKDSMYLLADNSVLYASWSYVEDLEITEVFSNKITTNTTITINVKNNSVVDYTGEILISFDNTNNEKSLELTNFAINEKAVEAKQNSKDNKFIGYTLPISVKAGNTVVVTADTLISIAKEYSVVTSTKETKSAVNKFEVCEDLAIKQNISFTDNDKILTLTIKNNGVKYDNGLFIRFQGTNEDKQLTLSNFKINGEVVNGEEYFVEDKFIGYNVKASIDSSQTVVVTADVSVNAIRKYTFKTLSNNSTSSSTYLDVNEKLDITQQFAHSVSSSDTTVTFTIVNNGVNFNDYVYIRFQGTNEDKQLILTNFKVNGVEVKVTEVIKNDKFIGYDILLDIKSGKTAKITADTICSKVREYKVKTLSTNCTSKEDTFSFVNENLQITQNFENTNKVTFTIENIGKSYYAEGLAIRFQGTNEDKKLTLTNFKVNGEVANVNPVEKVFEGRFLGYDIDLIINENEKVVITADINVTAVREYNFKSLSNNSTSTTNTLKVTENLAITQQFGSNEVSSNTTLTITVKNNGVEFNNNIYIRFQGTNNDKVLKLQNIKLNGNNAVVSEVFDKEIFIGYNILLNIKPSEKAVMTADIVCDTIRDYTFKTLSDNCTSYTNTLKFVPEKLAITQTVQGDQKVTFNIVNFGNTNYINDVAVRFQGTNEDKSLTLNNILVNNKLATVTEHYSEQRFLGYDVSINIKAGEEVVITADIVATEVKTYNLKTLSQNCTSKTDEININEKLAINEKLDSSIISSPTKLTITIVNNGVNFNDYIAIRFQGTNEDKVLTLTNFMVNGEEVKATEIIKNDKFIGYDILVNITSNESVVITANLLTYTERVFNIKTLTTHCTSSTASVEYVKEQVNITQSFEEGKAIFTFENVGSTSYSDGFIIRFQGTNEDKKLELVNFTVKDKNVVVTEHMFETRFLGYDVQIDVNAGETIVLTADMVTDTEREYKFKTLSNTQTSVTNSYVFVKEKLNITQSFVGTAIAKFTIENFGETDYDGDIMVRFQGTNEKHNLMLENIKVDGVEAVVSERKINDGQKDEIFLGYDIKVNVKAKQTVVITADIIIYEPNKYAFKTLSPYCTSSTNEIELTKETLDITQQFTENKAVTFTVKNVGTTAYYDRLAIRFQGSNEDKALTLTNIKVNGVEATVYDRIVDGRFLGYDIIIDIKPGEEIVVTADIISTRKGDFKFKTLTNYSNSTTQTITIA